MLAAESANMPQYIPNSGLPTSSMTALVGKDGTGFASTTAATFVEAAAVADKSSFVADAPPADGTKRVLEMIEEIAKKTPDEESRSR